MALDRNQAGLLFNIDVDASNAQQNLEMFKGAVSGAAAEIRDQFSRIGGNVQQSVGTATQSVSTLGQAATNQLRDFAGQFGVVGEAAGDMIPALSSSMTMLAGLAGAAVAAGAALASTAIQAMEYTGKIDDLATETNLTTETIQSLQLAATLSGQSLEDVAGKAVYFQKQMEKAKAGNAGLAATFKALGVDLDGPVDAAFRKTLERLNQVADGSAKTKTSTDLFGKGAASLLGVMDQVGGSFDNLTAKAKDYGLVLDEDAIAKSNELADRIDVLKLRLGALTTEIGIATIRTFDNWSTAIGRVSITMKQLYSDTSTFVPNIKKLLAAAFLSTMPGGSPVDLSKLFAEPKTGYSGPGIDPNTGLPEIELPKCKPPYVWDAKLQKCVLPKEKSETAKAAKEEKEPRLDEEKIRREYRAYKKALAEEEQKLSDEREKLRVAALDGEEARLRDKITQMEARLVDARFQAEVAAFEKTDRAGILAQTVANLEAEKALTQKAISEMEAARVRAMVRFSEAAKANTEKRLADEKAKELALLQNFQAIRNAIRRGLEKTYVDVGFSPEASAAIVAQQETLGRQLTMWEQMQVGATSFAQVIQQTMPSLAATMVNTSMAVSDALANMVSAFVQGRGSMRQVVGAFLDAALAPLRDYLMTKSKAHFALGIADLAMQNYAGAAKNFLAATALAGAAGLIKAGTSAISGGGVGAAGPIGPSGGGQFLAESRGGGSTMREQGSRRSEPQVIIIRAETEPGVMVSKFVQDYRQNGEARGVLRRDLLGEY